MVETYKRLQVSFFFFNSHKLCLIKLIFQKNNLWMLFEKIEVKLIPILAGVYTSLSLTILVSTSNQNNNYDM